jgi:hypothetical protein
VGIPEGMRPPGRPEHRSEDNIKMDLQEIGWGAMDCGDLDVINMVVNLRIPLNSGNFLTG